VIFNLPDVSSAALNRVTGPGASNIAGIMNCNGLLILVNPSGIYIAPTASINVGSIILSTRDIANSDFLMKNYAFKKITRDELGAIIKNEGTITVSNGGFGVMIAGAIENKGHVTAPIGRIALAAGDAVKIDIADGGRISVAIEEKVAQKILDKDGKPITDAIKNTGTLDASGGLVTIDEGALPDIFEKAINLEGTIKADTATITADGKVTIGNGGTIETNQSTIDAPEFEVVGDGDQHFYGDMTIYNFTCQAPGKTIYFDAGHTYDIPGELKIQGTSDKRIQLLSSEPGKQWYIRPSSDPSKVDIEYIKVQDSNNLANYLMPMRHSLKISNNTNWDTPWYFLNTEGDYTWELLTNWWENQDGTGSHPISLPGVGDDVSYVTGESGTVIITAGTDVNINNCYLDLENNGAILGGAFYGSVTNNNSIANTYGCNITFNGAVTNNGSIGNTSSPFLGGLNLVFNGTVDNYGTIGAGSESVVTFNAGVINREGSLIRTGDGFTVDFTFNGTVDNSGTIESTGGTPIDFNDQVINRPTGVLVSEYAGYLVFNDEFINEETGAFSNCYFNYLRFYYGGTDYNWETQENWFTDDAHTTTSTNLPGTSAALGYATGGSGTVVINSGTDVNVTSCALNLENNGTISGGEFLGDIENNGTINSGFTLTIALGKELSSEFSGTCYADVINYGTISGLNDLYGAVTNYGTIHAGSSSGGSGGCSLYGSLDWESGTITNSNPEDYAPTSLVIGTGVTWNAEWYLISGQATNNGTISGGSFIGAIGGNGNINYSDGANLYFGGAVTGNSLTINSGTFSGESIFFGDSGVFSGSVTNNASGTIVNGTYSGSVTNYGTIYVGTGAGSSCYLDGSFDWEGGTIIPVDYDWYYGMSSLTIGQNVTWDGTLMNNFMSCPVTNNGTISGGTFTGDVTNYGLIDGGMGCDFSATVTNHGTIASGTFGAVGGDGNISYSDGAYLWFGGSVSGNSLTINSGMFDGTSVFVGDSGIFSGSVTNGSAISGGSFTGTSRAAAGGTITGGTFLYDWTGADDGDMTNSSNWYGAIPGTDDTGYIPDGLSQYPTSGDCDANIDNYGIIDIMYGTIYGQVNNYGTIKSGTFAGAIGGNGNINYSDGANLYFGGAVTGNSLTINSGTFSGESIFFGDSGVFSGSVTNNASGTIANGTYSGSVTNYGTIYPGTTPVFTGSFDWQSGTIGGSGNTADFSGLTGNLTIGSDLIWDFGTASVGTSGSTVTNNGTISAGTFYGTTTNNGEINTSSGYFVGPVTNNGLISGADCDGGVTNYGTISNGTFESPVYIMDGSRILGGGFNGNPEIQNGTTINSGTFDVPITNSGTIQGGIYNAGTVSGDITVTSGNTLGGTAEFLGHVYLSDNSNTSAGGTYDFTPEIQSGTTINNGNFATPVVNNGTISGGVFSGDVTNYGTIGGGTSYFTGSFDLEGGSISNTANFSGLTGTLTIGSGQTWDYNGSVGGSTINNGIITAGTFSAMLNNGTIDLNGGSVSSIGSLTGNGIITDNSGGGTSTLTITQGSDGTYGGVIQDGASALVAIVKDGSGTLTLTGANSYSGGTTISGGTLSVGDGGTTVSITGDITNNSSLIFNRSNAYTYAGVISGSGSLTKDGSGTLTLTGANTYSGTATVNDGTLSVANSDALGTGSVVINTGGTLALDTITSLNIAGDWTNAGGTFDYTGTTVNLTGVNQDISGDNTFNDLTKTSAGTLTFEEDKTLTVSGMLTITGVSGDLITLNSSGADRWNINITSDSYDLQYLDVNDSNNLGTTIIAPNSTITNSIGWLNAPPSPPTPSATSTTGGWVPQTQDYICDPWLDWVMYQNYSKYWAVDEGYLYLDSNFVNMKGILLAKAEEDASTATA
jgi:filamentous hemagglutinin family protein